MNPAAVRTPRAGVPRHARRRRRRRRRINVPIAVASLVVTVSTLGWTLQGDAPKPPAAADEAVVTDTLAAVGADAAAPASSPSTEAPPGPPETQAMSPYGDVPAIGSGQLEVVAGNVPAPGGATVTRVRVEIEGGLAIDGPAVADEVMSILNDPRSWGAGGRMTFERTDGDTDMRVVLASPETSESLCRPLRTGGTLSCANGSAAIITLYRWAYGSEDYGSDVAGYRQYVVNHEVGHVLDFRHVSCPGPDQPAPVMMQQTLGLGGCSPNPWPYPNG